jgi:hypothetical protein
MKALILAVVVVLQSCAGWSYKGTIGYDKLTVSAEFYRPQGKQPVRVNPQK